MGGFGSGPQGGSRYQTVERSFGVDLIHTRRGMEQDPSFVRARLRGGYEWNGPALRIEFSVKVATRESLGSYLLIHTDGTGTQGKTRGELQRTTPLYGGSRWWLACPLCRQRISEGQAPAARIVRVWSGGGRRPSAGPVPRGRPDKASRFDPGRVRDEVPIRRRNVQRCSLANGGVRQ